MNTRRFLKGIYWFIPLILAACSESVNFVNDDKTHVLFSVDEFVSDNASRTMTDPDNGYLITWAEGDVVGIFPREGYQEPFAIPTNQVGKTKATFDGGYWAIKEGLEYNAYYPFDVANFSSADAKKSIPVTYFGQEQDGTNCNIGAFDYTYSDWKKATNGTVSFSFHHIGAICVFSLKYPATTTYTKLTLSAGSPDIPYTGFYDLTASSVTYKPTGYTSDIIMGLKNCSGVAGETGVFYMMLPPMDLSDNTITLKLTSAAGTVCTYSLDPLTVVAGKKYELTGMPVESNVEGTIDSWDEVLKTVTLTEAGTLSSMLTANEKLNLTSLKVVGTLNGSDIRVLRQMLGGRIDSSVDNSPEQGKLENLDLSEATIVEGGGKYYHGYNDSFYTSNNVVGEYMFYDCANLQNITLQENITTIGYNAFYGCDALTNVYITDLSAWCKISFNGDASNPISRGAKLYLNNILITELTIPDDITEIKDYAFCGYESVIKVTIPDHVISIGYCAFNGCDALTNISIGNGVTSIRANAFSYCKLANVYITDLSAWCNISFRECSNPLSGANLYLNNNLITELTIPDDITEINDYTFVGCESVIKVTIPDHVISIGYRAFECCDALTNISIGNGVTSIGDFAFRSCSITECYCYASTPPTLGAMVFDFGVESGATLNVPRGSGSTYAYSSDWNSFSVIHEMN